MSRSLIEHLAFGDDGAESFEGLEIEREYEIYLEGVDIDEIVARSSHNEHQEQWGIYVPKTSENAATGNVRVRKTITQGSEPVCEFTVKVKGGDGNPEWTKPADEAGLKMMSMLADQGLIKTRYFVKKTLQNGFEATLQIDVFYNKAGIAVPWVKVDAELPAGVTFAEEDIDFKYSEVILIPPDKSKVDPKVLERVQGLYEEFFRTPNKFV